MQTDGRTKRLTDMTKLIVYFCNFANASKNQYLNPGVSRTVCPTAGCFYLSYFEHKCCSHIYHIINRYTVTIILKFQNTMPSSLRVSQHYSLQSLTHFGPQAWPARSPDLTPLSFLKMHMKYIYSLRVVQH
jgi:hypothetical protein